MNAVNINHTAAKACSRCIYDDRISNISYDEQDICHYCHQVEKLAGEFGTGIAKGEQLLEKIKADTPCDTQQTGSLQGASQGSTCGKPAAQ